ncbi:hypothetical protein [Acinetobacter sp. NyZ410]|uniref:hypothetical protein n=1 Tax=Acinetobacter sp. NyZ410 TaxID=2929509 RepID=UPI001FBBF615|nr:hypothetical protein [Acinetobacter sp. NyZ410]UOH17165.1 hypothetical protein MTO68_15215 [Acinetobacter sp. NyZ410]
MKINSDYTFSLYITGINLSEINPLESAKLLEALCKIVGAKNLKWGDIREGSADYAVKFDPEFLEEKITYAHKSIADQTNAIKTITDFLTKYPTAKSELRYKDSSNESYIHFYEFKKKEEGFTFTQLEVIRGRVIGLKEGTDKTDHIQIKTITGNNVSVAISPNLSASLGAKWRTEHQLEFTGKAKYKYRSYDDLELVEFIADSIDEIPDGRLSDWIEEFKNAGDSGWDKFDDPIDEWLTERHE